MLLNINGLTAETRAAFDLFLFAARGRYLTMTTSHTAVTPDAVAALHAQCTAMAEATLSSIERSLDAYVALVGVLSNQNTIDGIEARRGRLLGQLYRVLTTCVTSIGRDLKRSSRRLDVHGAMGLLAQQRAASPVFEVADAAGRMWRAEVLVPTMVRDFAYQAYLDAQLCELTDKGDLATVIYSDSAHANHGLVFSISGLTPGYPTLADIRASIFHPNTSAKVVSYVSP